MFNKITDEALYNLSAHKISIIVIIKFSYICRGTIVYPHWNTVNVAVRQKRSNKKINLQLWTKTF